MLYHKENHAKPYGWSRDRCDRNIDFILRMHQNGFTQERIAKHLDVGQKAISRAMVRHGHRLRNFAE